MRPLLLPALLLLATEAQAQAGKPGAEPQPAPAAAEATSTEPATPGADAKPASAEPASGSAAAGAPEPTTTRDTTATPPPPTAVQPPVQPPASRPAAASEAARRQQAVRAAQAWPGQPASGKPSAAPRPRPPVRGDAGAPYAAAFTVERRWNDDPGYDLFAGDDLSARIGFWVAYDVHSLSRDVILAAEAGFAAETDGAGGLLDGALDSDLEGYAPHAGAQLRWRLLPWLQPHLRLQGGATFWNTQIDIGDAEIDNDGVAPFGRVTAGLLLRTPTRLFENERGQLASISFGLLVEGGYALEAAWEMELRGERPEDNDIPIAEPSLGELERSGPFLRGSLVGRF